MPELPEPLLDGNAIIDRIKTLHNIETDVELARIIGVRRDAIYQFRHRTTRLDISKRLLNLLLSDDRNSIRR